MRTNTCTRSLGDVLSQFLTPQDWRQAHRAWRPKQAPSRWGLQALAWVALAMAWGTGNSQEERFAAARAVYVACHQRTRRPGETLPGFLGALARLPLCVLRARAQALRRRWLAQFVEPLRLGPGGWVPLACDGTRLECPRSQELQRRLGAVGKPGSAPMVYLTTLVLLPVAVPWAWRWGKGTAYEQDHLRRLLPTLPRRALIVADAFFQGYDLFEAITRAGAGFLVRLSSRSHLYTPELVDLERFEQGLVYYWPKAAREAGRPPLLVRLLRVRGKKADVWLLTNVLEREQLGHPVAAQVYRWRWRNEGLFGAYKRQLAKAKLWGRTVRLVHREAEASLLALALVMAQAAQAVQRGATTVLIQGSPRRVLLRIRGAMQTDLRRLGPRQWRQYLAHLQRVQAGRREPSSCKVRQRWPRRSEHKPPKPPKIRVMDARFKALLEAALRAAKERAC